MGEMTSAAFDAGTSLGAEDAEEFPVRPSPSAETPAEMPESGVALATSARAKGPADQCFADEQKTAPGQAAPASVNLERSAPAPGGSGEPGARFADERTAAAASSDPPAASPPVEEPAEPSESAKPAEPVAEPAAESAAVAEPAEPTKPSAAAASSQDEVARRPPPRAPVFSPRSSSSAAPSASTEALLAAAARSAAPPTPPAATAPAPAKEGDGEDSSEEGGPADAESSLEASPGALEEEELLRSITFAYRAEEARTSPAPLVGAGGGLGCPGGGGEPGSPVASEATLGGMMELDVAAARSLTAAYRSCAGGGVVYASTPKIRAGQEHERRV